MKVKLFKILQKLFVLIVAVQIIDLSIDAVDFQPIQSSVTIGDFNYYNSIIEYVAESILGHADAFPEYQKESSSSKKAQLEKSISFKISQQNNLDWLPKPVIIIIKSNRTVDEDFYSLHYSEIVPPPPRV